MVGVHYALKTTAQVLGCVNLSTGLSLFCQMTAVVLSAEAVMSDDAILLKLEEDYTCPITQACILACTSLPVKLFTCLGSCLQPHLIVLIYTCANIAGAVAAQDVTVIRGMHWLSKPYSYLALPCRTTLRTLSQQQMTTPMSAMPSQTGCPSTTHLR